MAMKLFNRIKLRLRSLYLNYLGRLVRYFFPPKIPNNKNKEILIHIGCGELNDKKYINIDARAFPHVHVVSENIMLDDFYDNSVDLIYGCHVLEHVSHLNISKLLSAWYKKLKPGGVVRISVPDFDRIIDIYNDNGKDITTIQNPLMGGQDYPTNFHMVALNFNYLKNVFERFDYKVVRMWEPRIAKHHSFDDWSDKTLSINGKEYIISLNIEAIK
jgi:predicted SAM-dependent methyltransferase